MTITEKLSKHGQVRTCKLVHKNVVTIALTKGFEENAIKTFEFLNECTKSFPEHTILETCIAESHFALVVLTKP
tara:strand:- start:588 stop:809 length:222 start_codon:yes stop_codon:yes gene_type:complete